MDDVEGTALDLLARGGGGVEVDKVGGQGGHVQLLGGAQDIHGGAHRAPRHMAVVDGEDGMLGVSHIVDQGLTGRAEHLRDASCGPVEKFKSFRAGHGGITSQSRNLG